MLMILHLCQYYPHTFEGFGAAALVADNSDLSVTIPGVALNHVIELLAHIANGNAVTIAAVHAELTTQQAADMLGVSRPYLIGLLEENQISYRRVGNRRRIRLTDLLAYMREDDLRRAETVAELTAEAQRLNLDY
ncbi:MAG: helix-turn-helix domain-containing protein [Candidatus Microthrix sp.]|nr:helix-turn-helix domain-containing protein [Candidatus Microthrix sp.]